MHDCDKYKCIIAGATHFTSLMDLVTPCFLPLFSRNRCRGLLSFVTGTGSAEPLCVSDNVNALVGEVTDALVAEVTDALVAEATDALVAEVTDGQERASKKNVEGPD